MNKFKPNPQNKALYIALICIFSTLGLPNLIGIFIKLVSHVQDFTEYILDITALVPSALVIIVSIIMLNKKKRHRVIPWSLLGYALLILMLVFCAVFMASFFVQSLLDGDIKFMFFAAFLIAGFGWTIYLLIKVLKAQWFLFFSTVKENNLSDTDIKKLIDKLMNVEQLLYITDITVGFRMPYVDENGIISIYDSRDVAQKFLNPISFINKILEYQIRPIVSTEKVSFFQRLYDCGFESIRYTTSFGYIDLRIEDFPIVKSEDPIHSLYSHSLVQNHISEQYKARLIHFKKIGRSNGECSQMISTAAAHTNVAISTFCDSLFYVLVVPDNIEASHALNFSENAFKICEEKGLIFKESFKNQTTRFITYPNTLTIPYIDNDFKQRHILVFTKRELAQKHLKTVKARISNFEQSSEHNIIENAAQINRLVDLASCDICVMQGREIVEYVIRNNPDTITINLEHKIQTSTINSFLVDNPQLLSKRSNN